MNSSLIVASHRVTIYLGIPILGLGLLGGLFNAIVFLSLRTFRQNSCAFYLTVMSIVNIGQLLTSLLTRILISGFDLDWTLTSLFYCKFRAYCYEVCVLSSLTCMCLSTIDQYLATCRSARWQQWSNVRVAHRMTGGFVGLWLVHGIPYWIFYDSGSLSWLTGMQICSSANEIFRLYHSSVFAIVLEGLLPMSITSLFGWLAYRNIQTLAYRTIPLVRRELDKQLTVIVLIQIVYNIVGSTPYVVANIINLHAMLHDDTSYSDLLGFVNVLTICLHYLNFAVSGSQRNITGWAFPFF